MAAIGVVSRNLMKTFMIYLAGAHIRALQSSRWQEATATLPASPGTWHRPELGDRDETTARAYITLYYILLPNAHSVAPA